MYYQNKNIYQYNNKPKIRINLAQDFTIRAHAQTKFSDGAMSKSNMHA